MHRQGHSEAGVSLFPWVEHPIPFREASAMPLTSPEPKIEQGMLVTLWVGAALPGQCVGLKDPSSKPVH